MKVLEDEQICGDLLACLSGTKQQHSHDPARRVDAITQAVVAVRRHGHRLSQQLMQLFTSSIFQVERVACNRKRVHKPQSIAVSGQQLSVFQGRNCSGAKWCQVIPSSTKCCRLAHKLAQVFGVCLGNKYRPVCLHTVWACQITATQESAHV